MSTVISRPKISYILSYELLILSYHHTLFVEINGRL